jgi:potassium-dependent mechanosensitive channel
MVFVSCENMLERSVPQYLLDSLGQFFVAIRYRTNDQHGRTCLTNAGRRWLRVHMFIIVLMTAAFVPAALAAEAGSAKSSPAASIPLTEVAFESESAISSLREIESDLSLDRSTLAVVDRLPALTREIDGRLAESRKILGQHPSIELLVNLEGEWQRLRRETAELNAVVTGRIKDLDRYLAQIDQLGKIWDETLASAGQSTPPTEILERIHNVTDEIRQAQANVVKQRLRALTMQNRVAVQDARIADMLRAISEARDQVLERLLRRDGVPLWTPGFFSRSVQELQEESLSSISTQWLALVSYAERQAARLALGLALFALLAAALCWTRQRARRLSAESSQYILKTSVFEAPVATSLLLSLLASPWIFERAPRLLWVLVGAVALLPSVIIVERLIAPAVRPLPYTLIGFFFIDRLRLLAAAIPFLPRLLFLVEMLGAIALSLWLVRSPQRRQWWNSADPGARSWTPLAGYVALSISVAAFLANLIGYVTLSNLLGNALLESSYLALILYAFVVILDDLVELALSARPLTALGMVHRHRPLLQRRIHHALKLVAVVLWISGVLQRLLLRDLLLDGTGHLLTAELSVGSIRLSLGDVLAFVITVWAAFALSRFVRFLLEEDVYPRMDLKRGLAYAISSTIHYTLLTIGFFVAVAALGFDMTRVTILAGAFGVGVGFGLQNIFNNFISGLIVLFERPINIGDVIQIDDATGVVERIGIRASTIRAPDGSEIIVPNGKLISERLINRTWASRQRSIELSVNVAQGSDIKQVIALLEGVARAHPLIKKVPSAEAVVVKLGSDSLGFEVRAWTDNDEQWMQIRSEVAIAISSALSAAKIELR